MKVGALYWWNVVNVKFFKKITYKFKKSLSVGCQSLEKKTLVYFM